MTDNKNKNITRGDMVEIRWADAIDESDWVNIDVAEIDKPRKTKSIGYFINEDDECVRIAYSVAEDGDISYEVLPKGMVKDIRKIEDGEMIDFGAEK